MIKILHILWSGRSGGAERFVRDITIYSDKKRFEHEICFLHEGGWLAEQMAQNGIKVHYLGMRNGFSVLASLKLSAVINKAKPDIIHNHIRNYLANIIILFHSTIRRIYFEHGGGLIGINSTKERIFYVFFGRFYDLILANSNYVRDMAVKCARVNPEKVRTFYIGIDVKKYRVFFNTNALRTNLEIPGGNKVVGMVGRLVEQKGADDFIRVASAIRELSNNCTFVIVGEGKKRHFLENMAIKYNVKVHFLGDRQDIPQLLKLFDIFLFTSKWEPFGIVLLEAMAAGVPVVGFAVPGMKEIFEQGGGGILIEERDYYKLANIVLALLEDKDRYNTLSEEAYDNILKNFDMIKSNKILEDIYRSIKAKKYNERI